MLEDLLAERSKKMNKLNGLSKVRHDYDSSNSEILKSIDEILEGESQDDNFLFFRCGEHIKIYDRVSGHNGGKLSLREGLCKEFGYTARVLKGSLA